MNKYQLIDHFNALIKAVTEDQVTAGRLNFSKQEGGEYKVQFWLGDSRLVQVKEVTEDGILARVQGKELAACPHIAGSKEALWWENGWKLENYRRDNDVKGMI